jgi:cobalt-zinc-cadmium efflux system protein
MTASHAGHDHAPPRGAQRRALWISLVANAGFMVAEVIGGLAFHSLALLADAAHMMSDVVGLGIALIAQHLLSRPATAKHSYGLQRAEVLGGQLNGMTLLLVAAWIVYEAIARLGAPADIEGGGMLVVAALGLAVNLGSAVLLARARGRSVNMQGAFLHMAVDAAGSVGAIAAAVGVLAFGADWLDPVISLAIALLVIWSAWSLLRDTTHVLLEGVPGDMDASEVELALASSPGVTGVHHMHLWSLASDVTALSAHVVLEGDTNLHDAQVECDRLKAMLQDRFGIAHATLELECHECESDAEHSSGGATR